MKAWEHFKTINHHKALVMEGCFRIGLFRQGLLHDLSKYAPVEFLVGAKYFQGNKSPNNAERKDKGYSSAWLHHKGRNKHHLEYWIDYHVAEDEKSDHAGMTGMKMPIRYVCEMFIDRVSASKNYQKEAYTDESALIYYQKGYDHYLIHEDTAALLEFLLTMLAVKGEDYTYAYTRMRVLKGRVPYDAAKLKKATEKLKKSV